MAWALRLGGTKYGTFAEVNIPANTPFDMEFGYAFSDTGHGRPFGKNAYNNYNSRALLFYNTQEIRLTDNSGNHAQFTAPIYTRTDYNAFKFSRDINNDVTLHLNGDYVGTVTGFSGAIIFNQTGRHATASYASEGGLSFFDISIGGVLKRNYNGDASDHGVGTPKMLSDVDVNRYITGQNMAADGSAWLDLGGSGGTEQLLEAVTAEQVNQALLVNLTEFNAVNAIVTETVMQSQLSNITESNNVSVIEAEQKTECYLYAIASISNIAAVIAEQVNQSEISSVNNEQLIFAIQAQQLTEAITVNVTTNGAQDVNVVITEQNTQAQAVSLDELQLVQAIITEQITQSIDSDIAENTLINAVTAEQISESVIVNVDESSGIFISVIQTEQLTQAISAKINVEAIVNAVISEQLTQYITHQIDVNLAVSTVVAEQLTQAELIHIVEQNLALQLNIDIDQISLEILTPTYHIESLTPIYTIEHLH